ncbi:MAG: flagellar biosynthetic protein FliR [Deltaproteobacteria bacterium]|jgi:flagellar biosynthetic protein FliR|nr:flagellar biosynthetic protein FliR [Deltaproteobacteria bacterium]
MNLFNADPAAFLSFLLTLMRLSIVVFMLPVFNTDGLPNLWKFSISLVLALAFWPKASLPGAAMPAHPFGIFTLILGEMLIGFTLGLVTRFFFVGVQMGGEILAFQMGFTMITFADPATGNNTGLLAYFLHMVAILIFLAMDGHLYLLRAVGATFSALPAGAFAMSDSLLLYVRELSSTLFSYAIRVAAPVMVALFFVEMILALMSRTAPQMQIIQFGFPLKIAVGFFFLGVLFVIIGQETDNFITGLDGLLTNTVHAIRINWR